MAIVIRTADLDRDMDAMRAVFNENFAIKGDEHRFRWLYRDNPDGEAVAWVVVDDKADAIVGFTAVFPRRIRLEGTATPVRAWNCGDFNLMPKYRTMGVAIKLRQAARDGVHAGVVPFLYAHPNERMLQVHLKVGHQPLGRMVRLARPLRLGRGPAVVDRLSAVGFRLAGRDLFVRADYEVVVAAPGVAVGDFDQIDAEAAGRRTALVRDDRYVRWRFLDFPGDPIEVIVVRAAGRPVGYVAFSERDATLHVKDWLATGDRAWRQTFAALLGVGRARHARSVSVIALETHPDLPRLASFGFRLRPEWSTAVSYAPDGSEARPKVMDPGAWAMTVGDRDV